MELVNYTGGEGNNSKQLTDTCKVDSIKSTPFERLTIYQLARMHLWTCNIESDEILHGGCNPLEEGIH